MPFAREWCKTTAIDSTLTGTAFEVVGREQERATVSGDDDAGGKLSPVYFSCDSPYGSTKALGSLTSGQKLGMLHVTKLGLKCVMRNSSCLLYFRVTCLILDT